MNSLKAHEKASNKSSGLKVDIAYHQDSWKHIKNHQQQIKRMI
tara:strand:- start:154 stop:282 length:129 start_codon:yes stop_codon:yes gene_type:complete